MPFLYNFSDGLLDNHLPNMYHLSPIKKSLETDVFEPSFLNKLLLNTNLRHFKSILCLNQSQSS